MLLKKSIKDTGQARIGRAYAARQAVSPNVRDAAWAVAHSDPGEQFVRASQSLAKRARVQAL